MFYYNDLGQTTQELRRWTKSAIECYLNGLVCANYTTDSKCKQKESKCGYKQITDVIESEEE